MSISSGINKYAIIKVSTDFSLINNVCDFVRNALMTFKNI